MGRKTIMVYPTNVKLHSLYNPTLKILCKKYNLVYNPIESREDKLLSSKIRKVYILRYLYHRFVRNFISFYKIKKYFSTPPIAENPDLILAINDFPPEDYDYILDLEKLTALSGYDYDSLDRNYIEKRFADRHCKAIIVWSDFVYNSLLKILDCSNFKDKIKVVPFTIKSGHIKKNLNKKQIRLLFVSSINNPYDFELKGGIILLDAFSQLLKKHPNLKLFIRAKLSDSIKKKCNLLGEINLIEDFLQDKQMGELFENSDILLEPLPGINLLLDCMEYSLPVVAFNYEFIPEMVEDSRGGFLVDCKSIFGDEKNIPHYLKNHYLNYLKLYKKSPENMIDEFALKTNLLIENPTLRKKMAIHLNSLVQDNGKYSLKKREKKLLGIIDKALQ